MTELLQVKVTGLYDLQRRIATLKNKTATVGVKGAVRDGAQKIVDAAKEAAYRIDNPNTPENIAANITAQFASKYTRATGDVMYRIGVLGGAAGRERFGIAARRLSGKELPGGETWYWRFVEFGTSKMAARPFMRPAMEAGAQDAVDEVAESLRRFMGTVTSL